MSIHQQPQHHLRAIIATFFAVPKAPQLFGLLSAFDGVQIQCERLMIVTLQESRGDQFCLHKNS